MISELIYTYRHCLSDNKWHDKFDIDAVGRHRYKAYVIDWLNDPLTVEFPVLENISTRDVQIKRRASISGTLVAETTVVVTANGSPTSISARESVKLVKLLLC